MIQLKRTVRRYVANKRINAWRAIPLFAVYPLELL